MIVSELDKNSDLWECWGEALVPSISMRRHEAARDSNCSVLPGVCCPQAPAAAADGGHSQDLASVRSPLRFLQNCL